MDSIGILKLSPPLAFIEGLRTTGLIIKQTAIGLFDFFGGVFTLKSDLSQVSGPVGIAKVVGEARSLGFVYLLTLTALISINLAIINLLPFPALDGGRLLFVLIEAIIRRPIHPKVVQWTNTLGFVFLIILMLVVTTHDIIKLF
jgi:regulator of sigma E protease